MVNDVTEELNYKSQHIDELLARVAELELALQEQPQQQQQQQQPQHPPSGEAQQEEGDDVVVQEQVKVTNVQPATASAAASDVSERPIVEEPVQASSAQLVSSPTDVTDSGEAKESDGSSSQANNCDTNGDNKHNVEINEQNDIAVLRKQLESKEAEIEQLQKRLNSVGDGGGDGGGNCDDGINGGVTGGGDAENGEQHENSPKPDTESPTGSPSNNGEASSLEGP